LPLAYSAALTCSRVFAGAHFQRCRLFTVCAVALATLFLCRSRNDVLVAIGVLGVCPRWLLWWPGPVSKVQQRDDDVKLERAPKDGLETGADVDSDDEVGGDGNMTRPVKDGPHWRDCPCGLYRLWNYDKCDGCGNMNFYRREINVPPHAGTQPMNLESEAACSSNGLVAEAEAQEQSMEAEEAHALSKVQSFAQQVRVWQKKYRTDKAPTRSKAAKPTELALAKTLSGMLTRIRRKEIPDDGMALLRLLPGISSQVDLAWQAAASGGSRAQCLARETAEWQLLHGVERIPGEGVDANEVERLLARRWRNVMPVYRQGQLFRTSRFLRTHQVSRIMWKA
jgi:hypothetical protein